MQESVEGFIDHIIFRNEDNGYTVLVMIVDGEELTCVGFFQYINEGETIVAKGSYTNHPSYGEQFHMDSFETKVPESTEAIERYLASGAVKGIKTALAARIVKKFKSDTFRILEEEPERLAEIKGISENKAREIGQQMREKSGMRNAMLFLQKYGISASLCVKIYQKYGEKLYTVLQENPYRMAEDIPGVGFKTADEIAGRIGISPESEYRVRSAILYVLSQAAADGHVYLPRGELIRRACDLLNIQSDAAGDIDRYLMDMAMDKKLILRNRMQAAETGAEHSADPGDAIVYASSYYFLEMDTARMLLELDLQNEEDTAKIDKRIARIETEEALQLDDLQRRAVRDAVQNGIFIITGGPGTGKTTTINALIRYFAGEELDILLAAPTGRAAKRMTEATGYEAQTIHRMLELTGLLEESSSSARFARNRENPLEADVIIIDEMSMVDIHLMHALLSAVSPGTRLILVGDVNQLPSVGPGSVLRDMIESGCFRTVMLTRIFRQASQSDIVVNAHKIHAGESISLDNKSRDFFLLKRDDPNLIIRVIIALIQEKLPGYVGASPMELQVLTPMRKGVLGVENLNTVLQRYLNPPGKDKPEKEHGAGLFREGDKVMQIRNNYQLEWEIRGRHGIVSQHGVGIFNGDMGMIREINTFAETVTVEFDEGRYVAYSYKQLDELELAYAITIHKAQGSEYPAVILPLLGGPRMLMNRNLLYTAVTRARKCVTIVGSEETVNRMIANKSELHRYTTLDQRLLELKDTL